MPANRIRWYYTRPQHRFQHLLPRQAPAFATSNELPAQIREAMNQQIELYRIAYQAAAAGQRRAG